MVNFTGEALISCILVSSVIDKQFRILEITGNYVNEYFERASDL